MRAYYPLVDSSPFKNQALKELLMNNTNTNTQPVDTNIVLLNEFSTQSPEQLASIYYDKTKAQQREIDALECWSETIYVSASELFGDFWKGPKIKLPKRVHRHPSVDCAPSTYVPDPELLVDCALYVTGERNLAMGIYGDTGTGKSELPRYVSDKLNYPIITISLTPSSREDKVMGTYLIENGETFFDWSSVPIAYSDKGPGYILVVNEIDKGCDSLIAKLHDITDSKPFTIDDTAEVVLPHKRFRFIATGQTPGTGDPRGIYNVSRLDRAFTARMFWVRAKYPSGEIMAKILNLSFPRLKKETIVPMVDFYEHCITALENSHLDVSGSSDLLSVNGQELIFSTPTSIRLMKGWADLMVKYDDYRTVKQTYDMSIGMSAEQEDQRPMALLLEACFGDALDECAHIEPIAVPYPESVAQDISNVNMALFAHNVDGVQKLWMIGCDHRGSHTVYNHPEETRLVYFHKPMSEFDDDIQQLQVYVQAKADSKIKSKYVKVDGLYRFDTQTKNVKKVVNKKA